MKTLKRQISTVVGVALIGLAGSAGAVEKKHVAQALSPAKSALPKARTSSISLQLPREQLQEIVPEAVPESNKASYSSKPRLELRASASELPRAGLAQDGKHLALEYPVAADSSLKIGLQSALSAGWSTRW